MIFQALPIQSHFNDLQIEREEKKLSILPKIA